jgi:hypothetical protein
MTQAQTTTRVTDLHLAAFLYAIDVPLVRTYFDGRIVTFYFDNSNGRADEAATAFDTTNPPVPAQTLLNAWHFIQQILREAREGVRAA